MPCGDVLTCLRCGHPICGQHECWTYSSLAPVYATPMTMADVTRRIDVEWHEMFPDVYPNMKAMG